MALEVAAVVPPRRRAREQEPLAQAASGRANINRLNPGRKTDMGESSAVHGVEVEILPLESACKAARAGAAVAE